MPTLPRSQDICQRLLRGYQFSDSDLFAAGDAELYTLLDQRFEQFRSILAAVGYTLKREDNVIFLENEDKALSNEEKQTIVILFLLVDLWLERGKPYNDLFQLPAPWRDMDWFRDGYGREYLSQVGVEANDFNAIEDLFRRIARKGMVEYDAETGTVMLRRPAERLLNMARRIHAQIKGESDRG